MGEQEPLLKVSHLCQYFGNNRAVDDVSFSVYPGEVFGLVGESGCGKTTTGRCIVRLYDITGGTIDFKGQRIAAGTLSYKNAIRAAARALPGAAPNERPGLLKTISEAQSAMREARRAHKNADQRLVNRIQMIYQDPIASLDPRMTVYDIIAEGLRIRGERNKETLDRKVYGILDRVGLVREHAGRYPHEFSGGQRQRIGVARAVVMEPDMIIADEPVSALDVSIQAQVINLLSDLRREMGLTCLFIAHDLSVVKYFSDRIGVMYYGHLVEVAESDELFMRPLHPYTRALLSAVPLPDPLYERGRKRIVYRKEEHLEDPADPETLREILPGHFVRCGEKALPALRAGAAQ
ncbi:MAG: ATP-binding cassette domain-containing protein [Clostridiales bacterium]|nr:ATP-binding cassette domain-containing protein [Clostridiales bacterium]